MTDDNEPTDSEAEADIAMRLLARRREPSETVPELVHKIEIDRAVDAAKVELRREFHGSADRKAIESTARATAMAMRTSHRRWMTLVVLIATLAVCAALQFGFALENRARIDRLERVTDAQ